jgi:hypothetical protein
MVFLIPACSPQIGIGQSAISGPELSLEEGLFLGQSFLSRHRGLTGIQIFLVPTKAGDGKLTLHIRENSSSKRDLAFSELALTQVNKKGFYLFPFPSLSDSANREYYLLLKLIGRGGMTVGTAPGDTYLEGSLYIRGEAQNLQLAFRPFYDPLQLFLGLLVLSSQWLKMTILGIWLFLIPGWALLPLLGSSYHRLSWPEKMGLAGGISVALYPVLFLWEDLLGVSPGPFSSWIPSTMGLLVLSWRHRTWRPSHLPITWHNWTRSACFGPDVTLLGLIGLLVLTRYYVIRTVDIPMYGDSVHHTLIAQLLVDHGGLFQSWEPYVSLQTLTYHFGFHTAVAAYHWATGLDLPKATLWVGQHLNILAVIALIPLSMKIGSNRWAGVGAVLVGGLLAQMPMFYVNWGRYTQLAGQVILPAAVFSTWTLWRAEKITMSLLVLVWLTFGGLALTHYRVLFFYLFFIMALVITSFSRTAFKKIFKSLFLVALGSILFFPWYWQVFSERIFKVFFKQITTRPADISTFLREYNAIGSLTNYLPSFLWLILPIIIIGGLWVKRRQVVLIGLWWAFILVSANPDWLRLPGMGAINNFAVFIAFYIPVGILGGAGLSWLVEKCSGPLVRKWAQIAFIFLLIGAGLWGVKQRLKDVDLARNPTVTHPDLRAAAWIRNHLPRQAVFLVNAHFVFNQFQVNGQDAGWWLPQLTGSKITCPPLPYANERGPHPGYREYINHLYKEIQARGLEDPMVLKLLAERGITHLFVGQRSGWISFGTFSLDPQRLATSPLFRPIYHQDRVWIFEKSK